MVNQHRGHRMSALDHSPEALRWALKKSGYSQTEFAKLIGKSQGHVSEMLAGTRNVTPKLLISMARVLNCPVVVLEAKIAVA